MGMPASILLRAAALDAVDEVVAAAYAELRRVDALFSTYRDDSEISRLRSGDLAVDDVSADVREVLQLCEQARLATDGWFDIRLPGGLDPSGLVKGWAIERALGILAALPDVDICLNVGGDVAVRVLPGAPPFVAGIEDPHERSNIVAAVPLTEGGLATSGVAARGLHIIDPHTGCPVAEIASVSVVGPSQQWADVYSTATLAPGRDGLSWLSRIPSYDAMVVHLDGSIATTSAWPSN
ncbi:MAG: FAD:protein transferase [Actinomycetota bacterium]|nr:FAD:protein transferase [Actinomycetota bacterium]